LLALFLDLIDPRLGDATHRVVSLLHPLEQYGESSSGSAQRFTSPP
jgi:hypothetical protein